MSLSFFVVGDVLFLMRDARVAEIIDAGDDREHVAPASYSELG